MVYTGKENKPQGYGLLDSLLGSAHKKPETLSELLTASIFSEPSVIQDRWFKDTTVFIDGYTFERCRFDRCKLTTQLATFVFRQCFISSDSMLYFQGPSLKIARLLMHYLRQQGRIRMVEGEAGIYAVINSDGTFSLE